MGVLSVIIVALIFNCVHPLLHTQYFGVLDAERINIREKDGTVKAVLSNSAGFNERERAKDAPPRFSGLMFYNEEGQEEGGLIFQGKAIPGGQDSDVTLTMDQYRQDQNVYLNHTEHRDATGINISDGLQINSRPDWTKTDAEYALYRKLDTMSDEKRDAEKLDALRQGAISTRRLFYGVRRGVKNSQPFDEGGLFIKNRLGRDAIKLYVDFDNKPHFEVYDELGQKKVYELKLSK